MFSLVHTRQEDRCARSAWAGENLSLLYPPPPPPQYQPSSPTDKGFSASPTLPFSHPRTRICADRGYPCGPGDLGYQGQTDDGAHGMSGECSPASDSGRLKTGVSAGLFLCPALLFLVLAVGPLSALKAAEAGASPQPIVHMEGAYTRVLTLSHDAWRLAGPDAAHFKVEAGAVRFVTPPDFETPLDADRDNRYELVLQATGTDNRARAATIDVKDRDEPGQARIVPHRPRVGEPLEIVVTDPDRAAPVSRARVEWQRWVAPGVWRTIATTRSRRYLPTAADVGHYVRAHVTYADRHRDAQSVTVSVPHPVLGPLLRDLKVALDSDRARPKGKVPPLRPAFDPRILQYGIPCDEEDVMTVSFAQPAGHRTSVAGIQPHPGEEGRAAVAVTRTSAVEITVVAGDGTSSTYTVRCMPPALWRIRTEPDWDTPLEVLLAVTRGPWVAVLDEHGVSRTHHRVTSGGAGFFLRPFGDDADLGWAHVEHIPEEAREEGSGQTRRVRVRDRDFTSLRTVTTALPLTTTGQHDFRMLADGSILLMTYEPGVQDLRGLGLTDEDGAPLGDNVEIRDSAIQLLDAMGKELWTWYAWGRIPPEDCTQHRFPNDWAHINFMDMTADGILASLRGCSTLLLLDPSAPPGEEIVWRLGRSNLSTEEWRASGYGPPPLRIVGDPEGEFCGQHAAQLLPPPPGLTLPRLLLYDNGVACVVDPVTGDPLSRPSGIYSRVVEYALDVDHGEALFVRDHALQGTRDMLGRAQGHVAVLSDGDWLVSWGSRGRQSEERSGGKDHTDAVTRVDPDSGAEGFRIVGEGSLGVRALPVKPYWLVVPSEPLDVVLLDPPPAGHQGPGDRLDLRVAFTRPVAGFARDTASIELVGGELVAVEPLLAFGRPAHAWRLVVAPAGEGPVEVRFRAGVACGGVERGLCTADGEALKGVPQEVVIPGFGKESTSLVPQNKSEHFGEGQ